MYNGIAGFLDLVMKFYMISLHGIYCMLFELYSVLYSGLEASLYAQ